MSRLRSRDTTRMCSSHRLPHDMRRFAAFAAPAFVAATSIVLSVFLALPIAVPGQPATLVIFPGRQQNVLAAVTTLDPGVRLLGSHAGGLLLTIEYRRSDLPLRVAGTGAAAIIGVGNLGCYYQPAAVLP